ncbi:hypothetical protein Lpp126_11955 [Lacticaseibacillus paracasei subsp. paracasei Lpp126]|uniref:Uncharacterized protein n=1 Tax=Lacticaseibacillus paracasei subsp. paracasei Lpp126 TaxID=1256206 RepID=S2RRW8_LACPA|nr:hypothetical protein Lpp126_11955 [Lacticaseibacillus paracasei subsp. paracasei Lpp126]
MNEKGTAIFKKRYQYILRFLILWIGSYTLFIRYLFPENSPLLQMIFLFVIPFSLVAYLIYEYFRLKVAKLGSLILLVVLLGMLVLVCLQILKVITL